MAHGACLVFLRLVVSRPNRTGPGHAVTLQAQQVDVAHLQESRIGRSVDAVTARAALGLYREMFINEWALFIHVAFEASGIAVLCLAYLLQTNGAVHVVAVVALNQAFVDPMMKRTRKLRPFFLVAPIAKFGLLVRQQVFGLAGLVHGMAIDASHIATGVHRRWRVAMLGFVSMAREAALVACGAGRFAETEDLVLIASTRNVLGTRPVTRFASVGFFHRLEMRRALKLFLVNILVAGRAGVRTGILSTGGLRRLRFCFCIGAGAETCSKAKQQQQPDLKRFAHLLTSCSSAGPHLQIP